MSALADTGGQWTRRRFGISAADEELISIELIAFQPRRLGREAFAQWGIHFPREIARSLPSRVEEFFYGRLAASFALAESHVASGSGLQACDEFPIGAARTVGIGTYREPLWPRGVVGSIAHCKGLAVAAVAPDTRQRGIGIDVEHMAGPDSVAAICEVVVDAAEIECLRAVSSCLSFELLLTTVFSAKESFYKGAFKSVGRVFDFDAIQLHSIDLERRQLRFRVTESLNDEFTADQGVEIGYELLSPETVLTHFLW